MSIIEYVKEVVMEELEKAKTEPTPKYTIGEVVWKASYGQVGYSVPCPDCFGKKRLTVILGDDSEVIIPCVGCAKRNTYTYAEESSGVVTRYQYAAKAETVIIRGVEINPWEAGRIRYNSFLDEKDLFDTQAAAEEKAKQLAEERANQDLLSFLHKEKPERDWSWHVHYHRRCIKEAEQNLVWHRAKIEIALTKKGDKIK